MPTFLIVHAFVHWVKVTQAVRLVNRVVPILKPRNRLEWLEISLGLKLCRPRPPSTRCRRTVEETMARSAPQLSYVLILAYIVVAPLTASAVGLRAGLAKVDITPANPLRLRGAGNFEDWQMTALATCLDSLQRRGIPWDKITSSNPSTAELAKPFFAAARRIAHNSKATIARRQLAFRLIGHESEHRAEDNEFLIGLVSARTAPELQVAASGALADRQASGLAERLIKSHSLFQLAAACSGYLLINNRILG